MDRPPGRVGGVGDAPDGVAALAGQVEAQRAVRVRRERHALLDEPLDRLGAVLGDELRRVLVDEAGAGILRVADVQLDAVVVAEHADDAALGPGGRRLVEVALGEQDDRVPVGEVEGDGQAGEAGADDDDGGDGLRGGRLGGGGGRGAHPAIVCGRRPPNGAPSLHPAGEVRPVEAGPPAVAGARACGSRSVIRKAAPPEDPAMTSPALGPTPARPGRRPLGLALEVALTLYGLAVFAALWVGFAVGLWTDGRILVDAWTWLSGLEPAAAVVAWLLLLPIAIGLWAWNASLSTWSPRSSSSAWWPGRCWRSRGFARSGAATPAGACPPPGAAGWCMIDPWTSQPLRVIIAEDSALIREGLARLIVDSGGVVVAKVGDGPSFVEAVVEHRPDVSVVDVRMPPTQRDEGLRAAIEARRLVPGTPVLVLSQYVERQYATELLADRAGGVGYLLKDRVADIREFMDALRRVARGGTALDPEVVAQLMVSRRSDDPLHALTPREREVLAAMAEGRTNIGIAALLGISEGATEKHISNIFGKLELPDSENDHRRVLAVLTYLGS